jgi:AraC-like DNA-binding protein
MKRVFYDHLAPTSFEENLNFSYDIPYTLRVKKFLTEDIVPLHYGNTIEILLCDRLSGKITIDNNSYTLDGRQLFVIPPKVVHSNIISICDGTMYVLKISFEAMSNFVNFPEMFEYSHQKISQLSFSCPEYDIVYKYVKKIIEDDHDFFSCLSNIILIFNVIRKYRSNVNKEPNIYPLKNTNLYELINWTQENFNRNISIEDAANVVGYSKCHFCSKFKSITGSTYMEYLRSVRLAIACRLLQQNRTISEVCSSCGFDNISYFTQLFKKTYGLTPKSYAKKYQITG